MASMIHSMNDGFFWTINAICWAMGSITAVVVVGAVMALIIIIPDLINPNRK